MFGDAGRHGRSAEQPFITFGESLKFVGNVMLPNQMSVEIEGIVAVKQ